MEVTSKQFLASFMKTYAAGAALFRPLRELHEDLAERVVKTLRADSATVVDAGCGNALFFESLSRRSTQRLNLLGFDVEEEALCDARERHIERPFVGIRFADLNDGLPVEENSVDVVVSVNALYWLKDQQSFFESVRRSLKDGGVFLCVNPDGGGNPKSLFEKQEEWLRNQAAIHEVGAWNALKEQGLLQKSISDNTRIDEAARRGELRYLKAEELVTLARAAGYSEVSSERVYCDTSVLLYAKRIKKEEA
ncbi:MAG: class I SAM-dependent methyltransferase [bacterium]